MCFKKWNVLTTSGSVGAHRSFLTDHTGVVFEAYLDIVLNLSETSYPTDMVFVYGRIFRLWFILDEWASTVFALYFLAHQFPFDYSSISSVCVCVSLFFLYVSRSNFCIHKLM